MNKYILLILLSMFSLGFVSKDVIINNKNKEIKQLKTEILLLKAKLTVIRNVVLYKDVKSKNTKIIYSGDICDIYPEYDVCENKK